MLLESAVNFTNIPRFLAVMVIIGTAIVLYVYWKKKHTREYIEVNTLVFCEVNKIIILLSHLGNKHGFTINVPATPQVCCTLL